MASEEIKQKILTELLELKPESISTQFLTSKFKIGLSLAEEIKREYIFINSNCQNLVMLE